MKDFEIKNKPAIHAIIEAKCEEIGFKMPSDLYVGTLLKSLVASKPCGKFLELGTGIGLSLSWMVDGMDESGRIISIDNDPKLNAIVSQLFSLDSRVKIICQDGTEWIQKYGEDKFDLIFADAWPGKYSDLDEVLNLLKIGGIYVIDDMDEQPNWPDGHAEKAEKLIKTLEARKDFCLTKMNWSTGIIIMTKIK
ncbi:O-methyltransferase [Algoriphagus ratkowskyi]|uniref:Methyltransferase domain-containing protein n=1 Tax=Algoriphagus ratkowskyi TaxID=57028 RepID=A0A2W7QPK5_9BACT|nr:class I SAM-dependent methyltransferase [Algoriphagus ratkowskyi]PZX50488.1 O-methyltransferase [Algoriphagus ratkowskyi]TXD75705.1 methyltransferase domain-containing protein [Algoriphagus ratkowskyi]